MWGFILIDPPPPTQASVPRASEREMTSRAGLEAQGWTVHGSQPAVTAAATDGEKQKPGEWTLDGSVGDIAQEIAASGMQVADKALEVMEVARASAIVQSQGCRGMSMLGEREDTRKEIIAKGAMDAVAAAMEHHPTVAEVQAYGCSALGNFAIGDGEPLVIARGLAVVLAAMRALPADALVQSKACRVLGNCAFSPEGERAVLASGCVTEILAGMRGHPTDAAVQEEGCDALVNLAGSEAGREAVVAQEGVAVVTAATRNHPSLENATDCLKSLTPGKE